MPLFFWFCWSFSSVYNFFLSHKYRSAFFLMRTVWTFFIIALTITFKFSWKPVKHFSIHFLLTNNDTRRPFKCCDDCNSQCKHAVLFESCILYYVLFKMPIVCFCGHARNRIRQKAIRKLKTIIHLRLFVFKCFWNWSPDACWQSGGPWGQVITLLDRNNAHMFCRKADLKPKTNWGISHRHTCIYNYNLIVDVSSQDETDTLMT